MNKGSVVFVCLILILLLGCKASGQLKFSEGIDGEELKEMVSYLASKELKGRKTGEIGQFKAAQYISDEFKKLGLSSFETSDTYYQEFSLVQSAPDFVSLTISSTDLIHEKDFLYIGEHNMSEEKDARIHYVDLESGLPWERDVLNKVVLVYPEDGHSSISSISQRFSNQLVVVIVDESLKEFRKNFSSELNRKTHLKKSDEITSPGIMVINSDVASIVFDFPIEDLKKFGIQDPNKRYATNIKYFIKRKEQVLKTQNVIGLLEGSEQKHEYVVISAHYDHEGEINGAIFQGADDNASGVAALLDIAESFVVAKNSRFPPKKSIIFAAFTAEEQGLFGSDHFVNNLTFPDINIVANLNMDMIGRIAPEYDDYGNYVYLLGEDKLSDDLKRLAKIVNDQYIGLDLDFNQDGIYPENYIKLSDQWSFAKKEIPVLFYFGGLHDDYHLPSDTPEKIDYGILEKRAKLVFHTAYHLSHALESAMD
ncbi:M28 family metallopeptidase [Flagellimonas nanhaiensis]|uniref:Peptidase M28 domain-containing protein n=1 Tax=Flagellimonas nanhaiensis TaxID=2292706 RepID=A0A371JS60_9FLAO|nr:M28 family peptidase [Allomuricauda nanhaiensis]RDY60616.1 hypothetical protein DX873_00070 [Allomuricauda nanhaiensis]